MLYIIIQNEHALQEEVRLTRASAHVDKNDNGFMKVICSGHADCATSDFSGHFYSFIICHVFTEYVC